MRINRDRFRELLEKERYSQTKLARDMGISRSTLTKIYNGRTGVGMKTFAKFQSHFPATKLKGVFESDD